MSSVNTELKLSNKKIPEPFFLMQGRTRAQDQENFIAHHLCILLLTINLTKNKFEFC